MKTFILDYDTDYYLEQIDPKAIHERREHRLTEDRIKCRRWYRDVISGQRVYVYGRGNVDHNGDQWFRATLEYHKKRGLDGRVQMHPSSLCPERI